MDAHDVIVIGAGPAGLGVAGALRRRGVEPLIVERAAAVGDSWRRRYDSLRLNTVRHLSDLPGYRMERRFGTYPSRDAFVAYLERYAEREGVRVRFNSTVTHIARDDDGWSIAVGDEVLRARQVVVATGYDAKPSVPDWPGREEFTGVFMHAAEYRDATPFVGGDVLVVGAGSTASDVATDLVRGGAARVHVSIRTAPNIFPRKFFGTHSQYGALMGEPMPVLADRIGFVVQRLLYGDLQQYGLARPSEGMHVHFRNTGHGPLVDDGFVELVKRGLIEVVPAVAGFDGAEVRLVDGHSIRPRSVLAATGYVRQLEPLVGHLGLLAADGCPAVSGPRTDERAPGLYFVGFVRKMSGQLRPMRAEARQIARAASAALKREHKARRGFGGWRSSGSRLRQSREPSLMAAASTRAPGDADEAAG